MRTFATIAGVLLGLMFIAFGSMFLLGLMPKMDPPPEGSWPALFMGAMIPSGYMYFVKVLEVLGGLLVAIPRTRNIGLLILGPIIINILAFNILITKGQDLINPVMALLVILPLILLWAEREAFVGLVSRPA